MKAWVAHYGAAPQRDVLVGAGPKSGNSVMLHLRLRNGTSERRRTHARACQTGTDLSGRYRFAVVRHPLLRVRSVFHDKIEVKNCFYAPLKRFCSMPVADRWPAFVRELTSGSLRDTHTARQVDRLRAVGVDMHAIVQIEHLAHEWPRILDHTGFVGTATERALLRANHRPLHNTTAHFDDAAMVASLLTFYKDDMDTLGYRASDAVHDAAILRKARRRGGAEARHSLKAHPLPHPHTHTCP